MTSWSLAQALLKLSEPAIDAPDIACKHEPLERFVNSRSCA